MGLVYAEAPPEENLRSAPSRAYYSLYHETLEVLKHEYPEELAESLLVIFRKRKASDSSFDFQEERIKALDDTYTSEKQVSMHARMRDTLRQIPGKGRLRTAHDSLNVYRNVADYELNAQFEQDEVKAKLLRIWYVICEVKENRNPSRLSMST